MPIKDLETLQNVINEECIGHTILVTSFTPTDEVKTHPTSGKEFHRYGALAEVSVDGQLFHINKDEVKFDTAEAAANAVVAEVKFRLCHLVEK